MSSICQRNMISQISRKKIVDAFNYEEPKKIKTFWGNQKPHINKTLHNAIIKRSKTTKKQTKKLETQ